MRKVRSWQSERVRVTTGGGESRVRPEFKDATDIEKILKRYTTTGIVPGMPGTPIYGLDVSEIGDLKSSLDFLNDLQERIGELPEGARNQLYADPEAFVAALGDAKDRDDLVKLGLVQAEAKPPEPPAAAGEPEPEVSSGSAQ